MVILDGLNWVNLHISIECRLLGANCKRLAFNLVLRDVLVNVIHIISLFLYNLVKFIICLNSLSTIY